VSQKKFTVVLIDCRLDVSLSLVAPVGRDLWLLVCLAAKNEMEELGRGFEEGPLKEPMFATDIYEM
jgi:hypothetical protein